MDDNQNKDKLQQPDNDTPQPIQVEEVAPNVETPEQIRGSIPPVPGETPVYTESSNKFLFIGGIVVFFIILSGAIYWFLLKDRLSPSSNTPNVETPKTDVTLTYWGLWDDKEVFDPLIQQYQKENPHVTINYEKMAPEEYRERLVARSQAGNGPDIFRFHNTWLPEIQEIIQPLPQQIMSNEDFESTFYPIHAKDLKIGDSFYGIPLMVDSIVLIYNNALLTQAGLVEPPAVWVGENDVLTAVNALTVRNASNELITSGMAIGTANNVDHYGEIYGMLLLLNGGDLKSLDQNEAAESLQLYRKFAEENYWNESMSNSVASFIQGRTAMIFAPTWQAADIKSQNPELDMKIAPPPKGLDGKGISISTYWVEGVNKFSKNQVEAWKFLKFLSSKESETTLFEQQSKVRPFGVAYSRKDLGDTLKTNQYLYPVVQLATADELVTLPVVNKTQDNGLNDEILSYLQNAINQTSNGVDYSAALKTAKQGIDKVMERYKIQ